MLVEGKFRMRLFRTGWRLDLLLIRDLLRLSYDITLSSFRQAWPRVVDDPFRDALGWSRTG